MSVSDWEKLARSIGPLRYQMSKADCAPTTVINALLVIYQRPLAPALVRNIWALGTDFDRGTGFVGTHMLASLLNVWFQKAVSDKRERKDLALSSSICSKNSFTAIKKTVRERGVCCISISEGSHYVLLLGEEDGQYLIFDPGWSPEYLTSSHRETFDKYFGLVNRTLSTEELKSELDHEFNQEIHVIAHTDE